MMLLRLLLVLGIIVLAYVGIGAGERFKGRARSTVPTGITLVEARGCRECVVAKERLDEVGAVYKVVDVADAAQYGVHSFTVPYAFVGSEKGRLTLVRRGTAVAADAELLRDATTGC